VANAKVSLSLKGRIKYRTTTDSTGAFTLNKVKANEYTLKVTRKGYKAYKQSYEMEQKDVSSVLPPFWRYGRQDKVQRVFFSHREQRDE